MLGGAMKAAPKARLFLMPDARMKETVVRCPTCGRFVLRGKFEMIETLCNDPQCRENFTVAVDGAGRVTTEILRSSRRA